MDNEANESDVEDDNTPFQDYTNKYSDNTELYDA